MCGCQHIERYVTLHRRSSLGKRRLGKNRVAVYALPISSASESRHEILSLDACNVSDLEKWLVRFRRRRKRYHFVHEVRGSEFRVSLE
jgi:hypothetical protein